jgi:homopolymeric O-antigen transport system ATP-binding protein
MSGTVISVEDINKAYRLGQIGSGTLREDFSRWWAKLLGKPDPFLQIGQEGHARKIGEQFWALDNVSFDVKQGEVLGIIGRNGAGKSTLLKILSQVTMPTSGQIKIRGRIASLLEVGTGFHSELTGRENIFLNGAILGLTKAEIRKKFDEIVAFSGVEQFIDTPVKRYSSGMYVRLAFAVAAHLEPEILIIDEVLAVGDAEFQKKCLRKMQDASLRQGRTVLFVSHNMSAVRSLCNRIIWLAEGRVIQTGSVNVLADKYAAELDKDTALETDFSKVERAGRYGTRLKINRVRINRGKGIWHGKPLEVEFTFECLDDVEDVSFAVGFCHRDGGRIMTFDSDLPGARWKMKRGQKGTAQLCVSQLLLEPDFYAIDYGSRSGDNAALEYFPQCGQVIVLPSDATPAVIAMRESGRGGVRFPGQWSLNLDGA